jgi:hypothetical protein
MSSCVRCRKETNLIGSLLSYNKQTGRCSTCENQIKQSLNRFRQAFLSFCADGLLSPQEWQDLRNITLQENIDWYSMCEAMHCIFLNEL